MLRALLRSFHVDTIRDPLRSSSLLSSPASFLSHLTSSGTRSVATARGASLPRSRLKMRLGEARNTRNGHGYIIRDRNNARFPFFFTRSTSRTDSSTHCLGFRRGQCATSVCSRGLLRRELRQQSQISFVTIESEQSSRLAKTFGSETNLTKLIPSIARARARAQAHKHLLLNPRIRSTDPG